MPTVGPSDGGYQYYQRNISDLEDDLHNEADRARRQEKERTAALEAHYDEAMRDHDEKNADTLRAYKKNADDEIARERAYSKAEVNRIKNDTYDKFGRYNGQEADVVKAELATTRDAANRQYDKDQRHLRETQDAYSARLAEYNNDYNDRLSQAVQQARDSATSSYQASADAAQADSDQYRDQVRRRNDESNQHHIDEMNDLRRRYESATASMKRDYDHQISRLSKTDYDRFEAAERALQHKAETQTRALNDSHAQEVAEVRAQDRDLQATAADYAHGASEGRSDAVKDYEDDWRQQLQSQQEAYENQIDDLRQKSDHQATTLKDKFGETLREKDHHYAGVIHRQNQENYADQSRMQTAFQAGHKELEARQAKDREQAQRALENRLADSAAANAHALDNQAEAFQDTLSRESQAHRDETNLLQKELQYHRTSSDTSAISPAAEERLRRSVAGEYEKVMATETKKNRASQDSIQQNYSQRLHDSVLEHETKERGMSLEASNELHQSQAQFLDHVNDIEQSKNETLRAKDMDNERMTENLTRNYSQMLNRQKAEHDDVLQTQRSEASARMVEAKQDASFQQRMAQRAFANQQNELIREYDRKLSAQKTDYETKIDDLKTSHQKTLREVQRQNKKQLDELQKSYDQRMAQTEAQHAERERYLTENYQDELEKVRRANALLIQKKG